MVLLGAAADDHLVDVTPDVIAPNLLDRNFEAVAPDAVWLADISYITTDEGWLYLAAIPVRAASRERESDRRAVAPYIVRRSLVTSPSGGQTMHLFQLSA